MNIRDVQGIIKIHHKLDKFPTEAMAESEMERLRRKVARGDISGGDRQLAEKLGLCGKGGK
jgi:hypothetical protein